MAQAVLTSAQLTQLSLQTKLKLIQNAKKEAEDLKFQIDQTKKQLQDTDCMFHAICLFQRLCVAIVALSYISWLPTILIYIYDLSLTTHTHTLSLPQYIYTLFSIQCFLSQVTFLRSKIPRFSISRLSKAIPGKSKRYGLLKMTSPLSQLPKTVSF